MSAFHSTLRTRCQRIFRRHTCESISSPDGVNQDGNEMQSRETAVAKRVIAIPSAPVISLPDLRPSCTTLTSTIVQSDVAVPESSCADPSTFVNAHSDVTNIEDRSAVTDSVFSGYREEIFEEAVPSRMGHHDREYNIPNEPSTFTIPPMFTDFEGTKGSSEAQLPSGWKECTHSDGKVYFWHDGYRTITEEWIYNDEFRNMVTKWASILNTGFSRLPNSVKDWHLVIRILEYSEPAWDDDDCYRCQYYFVNHDNESLFWLSEFNIDEHLTAIRGPVRLSQILHFLRQEYWHHMYLFADTHPLSDEQWKVANREVVLAYADVTMSKTSTVAYSAVELEAMMKILNQAEKTDAPEAAATIMRSLLGTQFLNYHGQRSARTNRGESVFGDDPAQAKCTLLFKLLTPFLFYAPIVHLEALNKYWVDGLAIKDQWIILIERCTEEWKNHTVFATILLNANVAFLAIPSVDESMQRYRGSVTQVLSSLSVISSLSSILVGLLMGRYHRTKIHFTIEDINVYLMKHYSDDSKRGFEWLAIIYSIPYALLMWSMVMFLGAFFSMCWESPTRSVRISVVIGFALAFSISTLCIFRFWEGDQWTTWAFGRLRRCWEHRQVEGDELSVLGRIHLRLASIWRNKWKRGSDPGLPV
ncbi:uncharacterized protein EV420DRAFT_175984 [Desarmillaria tabescens]|uniref:WW domain-containing protein n=1 Tax=Armillaria tabescens TaxID=1929756 RepID=A0AA39N8N2_ARMTA|nr:uncharacterized protein EV420DRAFT_175984 [Desarmillaria tabescens]KAK0461057.1 hypothetical protein EV420DRAFT_175984 [Desarmillaria tabescens]